MRRAIGLLVLGLVEFLALLDGFPQEKLAVNSMHVPWARLLLGAACGTALIGMADPRWRARLAQLRLVPQTSPLPLAAHLALFASTPWLVPFLGRETRVADHVALLPWLALMAVFAWTLARSLFTTSQWLEVVRVSWRLGVQGGWLGLAAVALGQMASHAWDESALTTLTFHLVVACLNALSVPATASPVDFAIATRNFKILIGGHCSGVEGIGLVSTVLLANLWFRRRELCFPQAFLLLPVGILVIYLSNIVRITLLVILGTYGSAYVAITGFHSNFGWLMFALVSLGLAFASQSLGWFSTRHEASLDDDPGAYLVPLVTLFGMMLLCRTFGSDFDDTYPLRMAVLLVPLWVYRHKYRDWPLSLSWTALAVGVLVFLVWLALEPRSDPGPSPFAVLPYSLAVAGVGVRLLGSSLLIPLTEELAFRGYLLRRLISEQFENVPGTRFTILSFVGSSVAFGVLHQRFVAACIAGSLYAVVMYRRGNLWDAVQAHAVTNFCLGVYAIAFGQWSIWS